MHTSVRDLSIPNEDNEFISASIFFSFITDDDNLDDVRVGVKIPKLDAPLFVIRQKLLEAAKVLLVDVLRDLESQDTPKE